MLTWFQALANKNTSFPAALYMPEYAQRELYMLMNRFVMTNKVQNYKERKRTELKCRKEGRKRKENEEMERKG